MIKKRKNWYRHIKPMAPSAPIKPEPVITYDIAKTIATHYGYSFKLADLQAALDDEGLLDLPRGVSLKDVVVTASPDDDGDVELEFSVTTTVTKPNPHYEKALKDWEKRHAEWQKRKAEFKQELKEWTQWNKEQEDLELQERLKHAENLLKKHGRLKDEDR
jgi:hypothetical protein